MSFKNEYKKQAILKHNLEYEQSKKPKPKYERKLTAKQKLKMQQLIIMAGAMKGGGY